MCLSYLCPPLLATWPLSTTVDRSDSGYNSDESGGEFEGRRDSFSDDYKPHRGRSRRGKCTATLRVRSMNSTLDFRVFSRATVEVQGVLIDHKRGSRVRHTPHVVRQ